MDYSNKKPNNILRKYQWHEIHNPKFSLLGGSEDEVSDVNDGWLEDPICVTKFLEKFRSSYINKDILIQNATSQYSADDQVTNFTLFDNNHYKKISFRVHQDLSESSNFIPTEMSVQETSVGQPFIHYDKKITIRFDKSNQTNFLAYIYPKKDVWSNQIENLITLIHATSDPKKLTEFYSILPKSEYGRASFKNRKDMLSLVLGNKFEEGWFDCIEKHEILENIIFSFIGNKDSYQKWDILKSLIVKPDNSWPVSVYKAISNLLMDFDKSFLHQMILANKKQFRQILANVPGECVLDFALAFSNIGELVWTVDQTNATMLAYACSYTGYESSDSYLSIGTKIYRISDSEINNFKLGYCVWDKSKMTHSVKKEECKYFQDYAFFDPVQLRLDEDNDIYTPAFVAYNITERAIENGNDALRYLKIASDILLPEVLTRFNHLKKLFQSKTAVSNIKVNLEEPLLSTIKNTIVEEAALNNIPNLVKLPKDFLGASYYFKGKYQFIPETKVLELEVSMLYLRKGKTAKTFSEQIATFEEFAKQYAKNNNIEIEQLRLIGPLSATSSFRRATVVQRAANSVGYNYEILSKSVDGLDRIQLSKNIKISAGNIVAGTEKLWTKIDDFDGLFNKKPATYYDVNVIYQNTRERVGVAFIENNILEFHLNIPNKLQKQGISTEVFKKAIQDYAPSKVKGWWKKADIYSGSESINLTIFKEKVAEGMSPIDAAFETPTGKILKLNGFDGVPEVIKNTDDEVIIHFNLSN